MNVIWAVGIALLLSIIHGQNIQNTNGAESTLLQIVSIKQHNELLASNGTDQLLEISGSADQDRAVGSESHDQFHIGSMSYGEYLLVALPDRSRPRISQSVQYHSLTEQLLTFPMRKPFYFNVMVATVKTFLADLTVQILETRTRLRTGAPGRTTVDPIRSAAFLMFGFVYIGSIQWVLFVSLMTRLAPHAVTFSNEPVIAKLHDLAGEEDLVKQVMIDNLWIMPFVYFPIFYILKELLATKFSKVSAPIDALQKCRKNMFQDNSLSLLFWIPGDTLAFAAPIYMRLPIEHLVSFSWTMLLSSLRGSAEPSHSKKEKDDPSLPEKI